MSKEAFSKSLQNLVTEIRHLLKLSTKDEGEERKETLPTKIVAVIMDSGTLSSDKKTVDGSMDKMLKGCNLVIKELDDEEIDKDTVNLVYAGNLMWLLAGIYSYQVEELKEFVNECSAQVNKFKKDADENAMKRKLEEEKHGNNNKKMRKDVDPTPDSPSILGRHCYVLINRLSREDEEMYVRLQDQAQAARYNLQDVQIRVARLTEAEIDMASRRQPEIQMNIEREPIQRVEVYNTEEVPPPPLEIMVAVAAPSESSAVQNHEQEMTNENGADSSTLIHCIASRILRDRGDRIPIRDGRPSSRLFNKMLKYRNTVDPYANMPTLTPENVDGMRQQSQSDSLDQNYLGESREYDLDNCPLEDGLMADEDATDPNQNLDNEQSFEQKVLVPLPLFDEKELDIHKALNLLVQRGITVIQQSSPFRFDPSEEQRNSLKAWKEAWYAKRSESLKMLIKLPNLIHEHETMKQLMSKSFRSLHADICKEHELHPSLEELFDCAHTNDLEEHYDGEKEKYELLQGIYNANKKRKTTNFYSQCSMDSGFGGSQPEPPLTPQSLPSTSTSQGDDLQDVSVSFEDSFLNSITSIEDINSKNVISSAVNMLFLASSDKHIRIKYTGQQPSQEAESVIRNSFISDEDMYETLREDPSYNELVSSYMSTDTIALSLTPSGLNRLENEDRDGNNSDSINMTS